MLRQRFTKSCSSIWISESIRAILKTSTAPKDQSTSLSHNQPSTFESLLKSSGILVESKVTDIGERWLFRLTDVIDVRSVQASSSDPTARANMLKSVHMSSLESNSPVSGVRNPLFPNPLTIETREKADHSPQSPNSIPPGAFGMLYSFSLWVIWTWLSESCVASSFRILNFFPSPVTLFFLLVFDLLFLSV